jgi:predicted acetyltransferase
VTRAPPKNFAQLAQHYGYGDQAQVIHEFASFISTSPARYLAYLPQLHDPSLAVWNGVPLDKPACQSRRFENWALEAHGVLRRRSPLPHTVGPTAVAPVRRTWRRDRTSPSRGRRDAADFTDANARSTLPITIEGLGERMSALEHYQAPTDPADIIALGELLAEAYGFPPSDAAAWFDVAGSENLRCYRRDGDTVGGLLLIPMGQFWGGRSVPLMGFAGVAIAPAARGAGVATRMMMASLREVRQAGFPLAALYPATQPLYRRVGFEQAGACFEMHGPVIALPSDERSLLVRPLQDSDLPAVRALYSRLAQNRQGWLDRGHYIWSRVRSPQGDRTFGYAVIEAGALAGFIYYSRLPKPGGRHDLRISGWAANSTRAWRRLCTFVADHASLTDEVSWQGGGDDPVLLWTLEQTIQSRIRRCWMLRILDAPAAFTSRAYPSAVSAELHVELSDHSLPECSGRWVLRVAGGEATVQAGGRGELKTDERGLASLYSGYRGATELARVGLLSAAPEAIDTAEALLHGPPPSLPDYFYNVVRCYNLPDDATKQLRSAKLEAPGPRSSARLLPAHR